MANLFLPQLITWFRLDEHVKRLKGRVDALESNPGGIQTVTGDTVDNDDPQNPIIETPNLQQVTSTGNITNLNIINSKSSGIGYIESRNTGSGTSAGIYGTGQLLLKNSTGFIGDISATNLTNNRSFQLPDTNGTLLTDAPTDSQNYVRNNAAWVVAPGGGTPSLEAVTSVGNSVTDKYINFYSNSEFNNYGFMNHKFCGFSDQTGIYAKLFSTTPNGLEYLSSEFGSKTSIIFDSATTARSIAFPNADGKVGTIGTVAPVSATATGVVGEIRVTSTFIYTCIATNTWVRAAVTTW